MMFWLDSKDPLKFKIIKAFLSKIVLAIPYGLFKYSVLFDENFLSGRLKAEPQQHKQISLCIHKLSN